jgi:hypothetical protein
MSLHGKVAVEFASALVGGDFERAQRLLVPALRPQLTSEILRQNLYAMFRGYADGEPKSIHFDEAFALEVWPDQLPGDIGWAYVGIEGDDFVEGVAVTVTDLDGDPLIREIEWGRP